jgi:3-deoxy-D-manno-octulosonic-acid transferase
MPGCVRRSLPGSGNAATGRFLLDTIGELGAVYQLADLVVIGRTFAPLGGSDPTEPMALGKPVIIGPHVEHFASIVESLEHAHAVIRADEAGLAGVVRRLIDDADERSDLAARGLECVRQEQGASMRHAELLILFAKRVRA